MHLLKLALLFSLVGSIAQAEIINTMIGSRDGIIPTSDRYWGAASLDQDNCQGKNVYDDSKCRQRRLLDWIKHDVEDLTRRTITLGLTYTDIGPDSKTISTAFKDQVLDTALFPGGEPLVKYVWSDATENYVNKSAMMYCRSQNFRDIFSYQTVDSVGVGWGLQFRDAALESVEPAFRTRTTPQVYIGMVGCTNRETDLKTRTSKTFSWPISTPHVRVDGRLNEQGISAGVRDFSGGPILEELEKSTISGLDVHVAARLFCKRMHFDDAVTSEAWILEQYQEVIAFRKDGDPRDQASLGGLVTAKSTNLGQLKAVTCANQPQAQEK
jgi:hypothetical protein